MTIAEPLQQLRVVNATTGIAESFALLIDRPDLLDNMSFASGVVRQARWDEWNDIVHAWTMQHTTAEIVERAPELRIPVAPVGNAASILALDHLVARGVYEPDPSGQSVAPRRPWSLNGVHTSPHSTFLPSGQTTSP